MHCMHCICYAAAMLCSHAHVGLVPALALTSPLILTLAPSTQLPPLDCPRPPRRP